MLYRLYDSVNGELIIDDRRFTREDAEAYLLRHRDDKAFQDGDICFVTADDFDYDGDLIELQDLIDLA